MPGRCGSCRMVPVDCRVGAVLLLAMTKVGTGMGGVVHNGLGMRPPQGCHCEPHRGVAVQSDAFRGMPGRCDGLPEHPAGSPSQDYFIPCNVEIARRHALRFSGVFPCAVIARKVSKRTDVAIQSEALCGMPGRCGGLPDGSAGLPRRCAPRNDKGGGGQPTLGLRLLGLARLRLGPRPASLRPACRRI